MTEVPEKPRRRVLATQRRIESIIAAGQSRGLTPTGVSHHPDGHTFVHFGGNQTPQEVPTKARNQGWDFD